jgi:hypothetical protein
LEQREEDVDWRSLPGHRSLSCNAWLGPQVRLSCNALKPKNTSASFVPHRKGNALPAISAPTALVGGLLSLVVGGVLAGPWSGRRSIGGGFRAVCLVLG